MKTILAALGLSLMATSIIDSVRHDWRHEYGWALVFKIMAIFGAALAGVALT